MSGIVFFKTKNLKKIKDFYIKQVNCDIWMDQDDCIILKHGNLLFGFCERGEIDIDTLITFFYDNKVEVDYAYQKFSTIAISKPILNKKYPIYHFFAKDPDDRMIEFQYFTNQVDDYLSGDELLLKRRSIREYQKTKISDEILNRIFEICRFSPTSRNSQSFYFKVIKNNDTLDALSRIRDESSAPIRKAPLAVAICSDPEISKRHVQDGCIATYHFILASWNYGLGTCWIAAMDRNDVKEIISVPLNHYAATITPLGYPKVIPKTPERKDSSWFIK